MPRNSQPKTWAFGRCISAVTSAPRNFILAPAARPGALGLAASAALAACRQSSQVATAGEKSIQTSAEAGPGTAPISVESARTVFSSLCIAGRGSPTRTEKAAAEAGFVRSASTGTHFRPRDNLSVKLIGGDCSKVFASRAAERDLEATLTSMTVGSPLVFFGPRQQSGTDPYFNVRIAAQ